MEKITILVIDDESSNIQLIMNILIKMDYHCNIISTTRSTLALEIALKAKPTLIITDWEMPEMNGIDVIIKLKKNIQTKEIPVIMATGVKLSSHDLKLALDSGAFDFIRKPIDEIELIARICSALRLVDYYNQKIDLQKRELLSQTMMLIKINQTNEKIRDEIKSFTCPYNKPDCKMLNFSKDIFQNMIVASNLQVWKEFELHFEQIHESFYINLFAVFSNLTKNERRLCAYLRLNLSTKDIASLTFQSVRSVEIARIRLRNKLGLKGTSEDLNSFMMKF